MTMDSSNTESSDIYNFILRKFANLAKIIFCCQDIKNHTSSSSPLTAWNSEERVFNQSKVAFVPIFPRQTT